MKILQVSDFYPPTPGGMEAHVQRLADALVQRGHELAVVTGTARPARLPEGATIVSSTTTLGRMPWIFEDGSRPFPPPCGDRIFRETVRRFAEKWQPDLIHAHGWSAFSCYWSDSPPLVVTLHDHGLRCPKRTLLRGTAECQEGRGARCITCAGGQSILKTSLLTAVMKYSVPTLVERTSRFIAVSRSVAQRLAELDSTSLRVDVVPNFIDTEKHGARASADPSRVLFVGPDSPHKGRHLLIDAFRRLPEGAARLFLVGSSMPVNIAGVSSLGYLTGDKLREQYQKASVVVVPSVCPEACPTVVLEALSHGKPVIASDIGGIPDIVTDQFNGLLVPPNDSKELANALLRILTDTELRDRVSAGAQASSSQFSSESVVSRIEEVYASVLVPR